MLAVLLLAGTLAGGFHHHVGTGSDERCVVCALSHSPSEAPPVLAAPAAPVLLVERTLTARVSPPRSATRRTCLSRAPPLS
jgi:hypothetical protein